jgi:hypothetical protein
MYIKIDTEESIKKTESKTYTKFKQQLLTAERVVGLTERGF